MAEELTKQQKLFADCILAGKDIVTAARRAKYSESCQQSHCYTLLSYPKISAYLTRKRAEMEERGVLRKEDVERAVATIINADLGDYPAHLTADELADLPPGLSEAVREMSTRIETTREGLTVKTHKLRLHAKDAAIGHAMKMLGLDKSEIRLTGDAIFSISGLDDTPEKKGSE